MYDVPRERVVCDPPHELEWCTRHFDDPTGRTHRRALSLVDIHGHDAVWMHHDPSVTQPRRDFVFNLPHKHLGSRTCFAQIPPHALQAHGEATGVGRVGLALCRGGWGKNGVAGEVNGEGFWEGGACAWRGECEILGGCEDDVGVTDEAG